MSRHSRLLANGDSHQAVFPRNWRKRRLFVEMRSPKVQECVSEFACPLSHVTNLGSGVHLGRSINLGEQPLMTGALAPAAASTARP
jgi:hypothetical protein